MNTTTDPSTDLGSCPETLDTIALLQEEIARLEAELADRDAVDAALASQDLVDAQHAADDVVAEQQLGELSALLTEREQTIELLWDQVALLEEAEAAGKAEWEQLHRWVEELERRIGTEDSSENPPAFELDAARREAEALREQFDEERKTWSTQQRCLQEEVSVLRKRLEQQATEHGPDEARATLERENRRLREECQRLATAEALAASVDTFREQVRTMRAELDTARSQRDQARDDLQRERLEHETELASLRTRLTRERLSGEGDALTLNERMRVLREHLGEVHRQEEQERQERRLSTRLTRLWKRTGP